MNCEREENSATWKNKDRIRAILKGQAAWEGKKIHVAERKDRKKKNGYLHFGKISPNWEEDFRLEGKI